MDENGTVEQAEHRVADVVPAEWRERGTTSVWLTTYRSMRAQVERRPGSGVIFELKDALVVVLHGSVPYLDGRRVRIEFTSETEWHLHAEDAGVVEKTPLGHYIAIILPFDTANAKGDEPAVRSRVQELVGMLVVFCGTNSVFQHIADNVLDIGTDQLTTFSEPRRNPMSLPEADVSDEALDLVKSSDAAVALRGAGDRERIGLALRWLHMATFDSGVDAFLKGWLAIETLGMPDTTDIRPIQESLVRAYELRGWQEAEARFRIGRLYGLRSVIVHKGALAPVHSQLLDYQRAIFVDVFRELLDLPGRGEAQRVLEDPTHPLADWLPGG